MPGPRDCIMIALLLCMIRRVKNHVLHTPLFLPSEPSLHLAMVHLLLTMSSAYRHRCDHLVARETFRNTYPYAGGEHSAPQEYARPHVRSLNFNPPKSACIRTSARQQVPMLRKVSGAFTVRHRTRYAQGAVDFARHMCAQLAVGWSGESG